MNWAASHPAHRWSSKELCQMKDLYAEGNGMKELLAKCGLFVARSPSFRGLQKSVKADYLTSADQVTPD